MVSPINTKKPKEKKIKITMKKKTSTRFNGRLVET